MGLRQFVTRLGFSAAFLTACTSLFAQPGLPAQPTLTEPKLFSTFDIPQIRVVPVVTGLANPFSMAFRKNGDILITERYTGKLRLVRDGRLLEQDIPGVPPVYSKVIRAGLRSIALHPHDDDLVSLTYTTAIEVDGRPQQTIALARGRLREDRLTEVAELFVAKGVDTGTGGSVLLFAPDNTLLMSVGGAYVFAGVGDYAQDPTVHYGKLLRLNADGSAAMDNPFIGTGTQLPEVYSLGHRNQLGLAFHPVTGELWASENGPQGGDEVNIIKSGANYGWPIVSFSRQYRGDWVSDLTQQQGLENPEAIWWPAIAISAVNFYTGDKLPAWQGNLFVGSMMTGRVPGTGHLERIVFNSRGDEVRREAMLRELGQRIRDVQQGPDGYLYLLTDEADGALLRIEMAPPDNSN